MGSVDVQDQFWYCDRCWARQPPREAPGPQHPQHPPPGAPHPYPPPVPSHTAAYGYWAHVPPPVSPWTYPSSPYRTERTRNRSRSRGEADDDARARKKRKTAPAASEKPENSGPPTTLMLRNIPDVLRRDALVELLEAEGMGSMFDFVYVPIRFGDQERNFGYAFVNCVTPEAAEECREKFHGFDRWPVPWNMTCEVNTGDSCQGVSAHVQRYRNSPVMHESVPDEFKPAVYKNGERQPFPKPTKAIRKPRPRKRDKADGTAKAPEQEAEDEDGMGAGTGEEQS